MKIKLDDDVAERFKANILCRLKPGATESDAIEWMLQQCENKTLGVRIGQREHRSTESTTP